MQFTDTQLDAIDHFVYQTCLVAIQHIKNVVELRKAQDRTLGYHSRLLERLLHPEDVLIYKGTSKAALEHSASKYKEHIVPMVYLQDALWALVEQGEKSDAQLAQLLKNHLGVAYITKEEARKLDHKLSLKTKMPKNWLLGENDPIDRLKEAGIVLLNDEGIEIRSLL